MANLMKIPGGWADRKAEELKTSVEPEAGKFIYFGCCVNMRGEDVDRMVDSNKWEGKDTQVQRAMELREIKEKCSNVMEWAKTMGYAEDPKDGLILENDWSLSYGKGDINGVWCYWIDHSRIEYVWIDPDGAAVIDTETGTYLNLDKITGMVDPAEFKQDGIRTGRMSCKDQNLANAPKSLEDYPPEMLTPAERAGLRARRRKK